MIFSSKYEVIDKIGQGGMGVVYRVRHVELGTVLALKMLPQELMHEPELVARFRREARVMARLNHPNIVRVFDLVQDDAQGSYLVMEFLQGKNLSQHLKAHMSASDQPLALLEVLRIGTEICAALVYAHEQNPAIVHRDIKPANIIIEDASRRVVVTDFGIAKLVGESQTQLTRTGGFVGTLKYCAPEQMRHDPDVDGRADIYSLGMVLYELYTGRQFFAGLNDEEVIGRVLYATEEEGGLPESEPDFARIIKQAIARDRYSRYGSARALLLDLQDCLQARGLRAPDLPLAGRADISSAPSVGPTAGERSREPRAISSSSWSPSEAPTTGSTDSDWTAVTPESEETRRTISLQRRITANLRYILARWWVIASVVPALVIAAVCTTDGLPWIGRTFPGFFVMENAVVPTAGAYHWTGMKAGLPNHSSVLKVDGSAISAGNDVYAFAEKVPPGTPLTYTMRKQDATFDISIATMGFTQWDYALTFGLLGFNGFIIIFTGFAVAMLNPGNRAARVFLLMSLLIGLYPVTGCDLWRTHDFTILQLVLQCVGPATFLHLALVFPVERQMGKGIGRLVVALPYAAGMVLTVFLLRGFWAEPVNLFPLYVGYAYSGIGFFAMVASGVLAYVQYRRAVVRGRVQVVMVGLLCAFVLPILGFFNNMLSGGDFPLNYIAFTPPIFFIAVAYAIVKHKLFDTQLFIRRSVMLACLLAGFTTTYVAVVTLLNTVMAGTGIEPHSPEFMGGFMALSLASALPLRDQLNTAIERRLFPHKFRSHQTIDLLCRSIARTDDLSTVLDEATRGLASAMNLTAGAVLLRDGDESNFRTAAAFGAAPPGYVLGGDSPLIRVLSGTRREVFAEDFQENPELSGIRDSCLETLGALKAEIVIPLLSGSTMVGVLALGRHAGSDILTSEDLQMLRSLAAGLALAAVRNADVVSAQRMMLRRRILEHYLPPPALRALLGKDPIAPVIERIRITTLTVRLVDMTELSDRLGPESLTDVLREFYALCTAAVRDHGGIVEHREADRVRAIFRMEPGAESDALRAARTALTILEALRVYRATQGGREYVGEAAAGLASGVAHVARIEVGSQTTVQVLGSLGAIGERLSEYAQEDQVLANRSAGTAIVPQLTGISLGSVEVPGLPTRLEVFEVAEKVSA